MVRFYLFWVLINIFLPNSILGQTTSDAKYLPFSHAHNDYEKLRKPFFEAYRLGFQSIEVDVFPHKGKLIVSHISLTLPVSKSLEELYIKPISEYLATNAQKDKRAATILMVDIKRKPDIAFQRLISLVEAYPSVFRKWTGEDDSTGGIRLLLSGAVPTQLVIQDTSGYIAMDGRPTLVHDSRFSQIKMPRISVPYHSISHWGGIGPMPPKQEDALQRLIKEAHTSGRKIRLWGMPNSKKVWGKMIRMGVDWINVDKIVVYKNYISQQTISKPINKPF